MDLLAQIFQFDVLQTLIRVLEEDDLELVADHKDFVYVDGEEGDYGIVRYSDAQGNEIAVRTIHGGDSDDVTLTEFGAALVRERLQARFAQVVAQKVVASSPPPLA